MTPEEETAMVDAAMVEMRNIFPPLRRSECARLIHAALSAAPAAPQGRDERAAFAAWAERAQHTNRMGTHERLWAFAAWQARAALSAAPAAPQEPDMRAVCEALGFDPTNHHNAAKCPYCRPAAPQEPLNIPPCKGMNCGTTTGRDHSPECEAEHAAAIAGGTFVPAAPQEPRLPNPDIVVTDTGEAWGYKGNENVAGTHYYTADQMRAAMKDET